MESGPAQGVVYVVLVVKRHSAMADNRGTAGEQETLWLRKVQKAKSCPRMVFRQNN